MALTRLQLLTIMPNAGAAVDVFLGPLNSAMARFNITSPAQQAAFLANVAVESGELKAKEENMYFKSAARIAEVWPTRFTAASAEAYTRSPERLANKVYSGRNGNGDEASGDGWRYRARTLIGLTFKANYAEAGRAIGVDLVTQPDLASAPAYSALVAAWFFSSKGCGQLADSGAFDAVCTRINGGSTGIDARRTYYQRALKALQGA